VTAPLYPLERLADELIEKCCGTHSLGSIYRFLRDAGMDELEARMLFREFVSGRMPEKLLDEAAQYVQSTPINARNDRPLPSSIALTCDIFSRRPTKQAVARQS
jgi:hypothetical protein